MQRGVTITEAVERTGVSRATLYRLVEAGAIRYRKGRAKFSHIRLHPEDVNALAQAGWEGKPLDLMEVKL